MGKWEYRTYQIPYDRKKHKDWVVQFGDDPPVVGLQAILDLYGSHGWELVSLNLESWQAFPSFGRYDIEPEVYRATFKRPVQES